MPAPRTLEHNRDARPLRTLAAHAPSRSQVLADAARVNRVLADMRRATTLRART